MLRYVGCLVIFTCLAMAQNAKMTGSSSTGSSSKVPQDHSLTPTKPLTPKSAMPTPHKSAAVPPMSNSTQKTANELTRIERGSGPAPQPKKNSAAAKNTTKAADSSGDSSSSPPIKAKYTKPVGGMTANTPDANTKNSGVPRVNKPN